MAFSWPVLLAYYQLRARTDGKYGRTWKQRMGLDLPEATGKRARIWCHALSVGEVLSAVPLVKGLKERAPGVEIVFSTATETGQEIARSRLASWVELFFILPHDFPWTVERLVPRVRPDLFVLVETDIWLNLLHALKRRGIPVVLVNGRLSPRSFERIMKYGALFKPAFRLFDRIYAQSEEDRARYEASGVTAPREQATGNLKSDS